MIQKKTESDLFKKKGFKKSGIEKREREKF